MSWRLAQLGGGLAAVLRCSASARIILPCDLLPCGCDHATISFEIVNPLLGLTGRDNLLRSWLRVRRGSVQVSPGLLVEIGASDCRRINDGGHRSDLGWVFCSAATKDHQRQTQGDQDQATGFADAHYLPPSG